MDEVVPSSRPQVQLRAISENCRLITVLSHREVLPDVYDRMNAASLRFRCMEILQILDINFDF